MPQYNALIRYLNVVSFPGLNIEILVVSFPDLSIALKDIYLSVPQCLLIICTIVISTPRW